MRALAIVPGTRKPQVLEVAEPKIATPRQALVRVLRVGVCSTDRRIAHGLEGEAPPGEPYLVMGHEMMGRVVEVGTEVTSLKPGDLVVATVRRGCGRCASCLHGESDMCTTGLYTERGIKGAHGYLTDFIVEEESYLVPIPEELEDIGVLLEPLSNDVKAVEVLRRLQARARPRCGHPEHAWDRPHWGGCKRALVTGAGPIGMLAAFLLRNQGVETFALALRPARDNPKARLLEEIGCHYLAMAETSLEAMAQRLGPLDLILEATGDAKLPFDLLPLLGPSGIMVLLGIPGGKVQVTIDGALLIREAVLRNMVLVGSVNANRRHFQDGIAALRSFKERFGPLVARLITQTYPLEAFSLPLYQPPRESIKATLELEVRP